jgi:hypothetical protein
MFFDRSLKIFQLILLGVFIFSVGCNKKNADMDNKKPMSAKEKRRQNIEQGKGASLGSIIGKARGGTNYEFSSSNPMWRASLETLDFLPLATVDYSGGVIITDWYSDSNSSKESLKITIRFLSNEIRSDSIKIIIHKRNCVSSENCTTNLLPDNQIKNELRATILRKASLFQKAAKNKK